MPRWVSTEGVWTPATERAINPEAKPGENPVYEGPDRAATEVLKDAKVDHLGTHYSLDPEVLMVARQMHYATVEDYLKAFNYDGARAKAHAQAFLAEVATHQPQAPKPMIQPSSGGDEQVPGGTRGRKGGFDLPADVPGGKA